MTPLVKAILHTFDEYEFGFMRSDIDAPIRRNANYLAALGLVTYTEIMGGLRTGDLGIKRTSAANFNAFLPYLGTDYELLKTQGIDIYSLVRCGLVHNYFIKGDSTMWMRANAPCGIIASSNGPTYFIVNVYRDHFFSGATKFRDAILDGKDPSLVANFEKGMKQIDIPLA